MNNTNEPKDISSGVIAFCLDLTFIASDLVEEVPLYAVGVLVLPVVIIGLHIRKIIKNNA